MDESMRRGSREKFPDLMMEFLRLRTEKQEARKKHKSCFSKAKENEQWLRFSAVQTHNQCRDKRTKTAEPVIMSE
jgi:hypothetical protein